MNRIREIDPLTDTMIVEAGVTLLRLRPPRRAPTAVSAVARLGGTCTIAQPVDQRRRPSRCSLRQRP